MKIEITPLAEADLDEILRFISRENPVAAIDVVTEILIAIDLLVEQPQMGRPARQRGLRELVAAKHYVIPYRVRGDVVEVLRVWHGRLNWKSRGK